MSDEPLMTVAERVKQMILQREAEAETPPPADLPAVVDDLRERVAVLEVKVDSEV